MIGQVQVANTQHIDPGDLGKRIVEISQARRYSSSPWNSKILARAMALTIAFRAKGQGTEANRTARHRSTMDAANSTWTEPDRHVEINHRSGPARLTLSWFSQSTQSAFSARRSDYPHCAPVPKPQTPSNRTNRQKLSRSVLASSVRQSGSVRRECHQSAQSW